MSGFDLDAVLADGEPFSFTFGGQEYTLPADPPLTVPPLLRAGLDAEAVELLLGAEQWERLSAADPALGMKGATALLVAYQAHLGLAPGGS